MLPVYNQTRCVDTRGHKLNQMSAGKSMAWSAFTFSVGSKGFGGSFLDGAAGFCSLPTSPWAFPRDGGGAASGGRWPVREGPSEACAR